MSQVVPMVIALAFLLCPTFPYGHGMRIIKPDQPFPILVMQRQGVIKAMRLFRTGRNLGHPKLHPVFSGGIDHENLPVQFQQRIQSVVPLMRFHAP